ncbi:MAG: hypothetical protein V3V67_17315 [Myxococcota bacterium]
MTRAACVLLALLYLSLGSGIGSASAARAQSLVVIVNGANDVSDVSVHDLSRIYKLSRRRWPDGTPISLYLPPPTSDAAKLLATKLLKVGGEADMFTFYLRAIFRQKITAVPESVNAAPVAIERVATTLGGIALVDRDDVAASERVRVIEVDGL